MRTFVYVDGFNLYYRALKGTPYKWLDLKRLIERILRPHCRIERIKYFTTLVLPTTRSPDKHIRQQTYIRAVEHFLPEVDVYYGRFIKKRDRLPLAHPSSSNTFAEVLRMEEKGSDVNLGVHLVNDAAKGEYQCGVVVSNDADLAEAVRIAGEEHDTTIGIVSPQHPVQQDLKEHASFFRYIRRSTLADSQLPDPIPGTSIRKPSTW